MSKAKPVSLHRSAWVLALSFSVGLPVAPAQTGSKKKGEYLAPYVPTPMPVVEKMLELAKLTKDDVVYDLGCGDGRIVVHAAAKYGARGVGVDYDPVRVAEANAEVLKAKVQDRVTILEHDAMTVDISAATVVTLYLLPDSNRKLKPRLENLLPAGTRVITHDFRMPGWEPIREVTVNQTGTYSHRVYVYRTPGGDALSGTWTWHYSRDGEGRTARLRLREDGDKITGALVGPRGGEGRPVKSVERIGDSVIVEVEILRDDQPRRLRFAGALRGDRIVGTITTGPDATPREWTARREAINVDGTWAWTDGGAAARLQLRRTGDGIRGTLTVGEKEATVTKVETVGSRLEVEARLPQGSVRQAMWFRGWIEDDTIVGTVRTERPDAPTRPWRARRVVVDKGV